MLYKRVVVTRNTSRGVIAAPLFTVGALSMEELILSYPNTHPYVIYEDTESHTELWLNGASVDPVTSYYTDPVSTLEALVSTLPVDELQKPETIYPIQGKVCYNELVTNGYKVVPEVLRDNVVGEGCLSLSGTITESHANLLAIRPDVLATDAGRLLMTVGGVIFPSSFEKGKITIQGASDYVASLGESLPRVASLCFPAKARIEKVPYTYFVTPHLLEDGSVTASIAITPTTPLPPGRTPIIILAGRMLFSFGGFRNTEVTHGYTILLSNIPLLEWLEDGLGVAMDASYASMTPMELASLVMESYLTYMISVDYDLLTINPSPIPDKNTISTRRCINCSPIVNNTGGLVDYMVVSNKVVLDRRHRDAPTSSVRRDPYFKSLGSSPSLKALDIQLYS